MNGFKKTPFLLMALLLAAISLSACDGLATLGERTYTFNPSKTASIMVTDLENFGVCAFTLDRRGASFFLWGEFLRERETARFPEPAQLAGYEVLVQRGETCHLRTVNFFQAAAAFDLDSLSSSAIVSAELSVNDTIYAGTDPPVLFGSSEQCTHLLLGQATEPWEAGTYYNTSTGEGSGARPLITWTPARNDSGPFRSLPDTLDVTRTVSEWARGVRPNNGFVFTPDLEAISRIAEGIDEGGILCPMWLDSFQLKVTVAETER
jgi:hypothetical protein